MVSSPPPIIAFSCNLIYHTARNILENHEFVINIVGEHILEQALETAKDYPKGVNELDRAQLTAMPSQTVTPPRIAECLIHLECTEEFHKTYDDEIIFFGQVAAAFFDEDILRAPCEKRYRMIQPVFPLGERKYAILGEVKPFPGW
jgi:flavin reductase (DIM6/NTAB) family NADH-FMN oxidoreductase RutF